MIAALKKSSVTRATLVERIFLKNENSNDAVSILLDGDPLAGAQEQEVPDHCWVLSQDLPAPKYF